MITPSLPVLLIAGLFGAIVGSFLNVVILRLPEKESLLFPASHCPHCNTPLHWYENIPVLSYIVLRGRCGHCRAGISWQYPVVELLTALLAVAIVSRFGLSFTAGGYFLFAAALVVVIFIDIQLQIIPDLISLPGILLGVIFALFSDALSWQSSLIGLLAGGGVLYAVAVGYLLWRKVDGMGGGDIKLLAMIGAWLGWQSLPFVILASSAGGALVGLATIVLHRNQGAGSQTRIPFGPFLSLAALAYLFFSDKILYFYHLYLTGQWP